MTCSEQEDKLAAEVKDSLRTDMRVSRSFAAHEAGRQEGLEQAVGVCDLARSRTRRASMMNAPRSRVQRLIRDAIIKILDAAITAIRALKEPK